MTTIKYEEAHADHCERENRADSWDDRAERWILNHPFTTAFAFLGTVYLILCILGYVYLGITPHLF